MKDAKRPSHPRRECDRNDVRGRREDLFDLMYPLARRAANVRASSVIPRYDYLDREDLEQDGLVAVLAAIDRYDVSRSSLRTFVERIVSNRTASILRRDRAGKRTQSADYRPPVKSPRLFVTLELRLDLDRVLATLGRRERRVARLLEEYRPAEVARALGICRAAVYRSIDCIREAFSEAGLP
jgi:RNA polymerase sigma factor (sigma-70 family)